MTVLIKRYANRKLYNTQTSRYITLKGISELLEVGEEVRVIDNETGEDITNVALSQILVDSEREGRQVPKSLLSDLFQKGGDALYGALRKGAHDATEGIEEFRENVRKIVRPADGEKIRDWVGFSAPDFDHMVQNAIERVFKVLDLPRRGDIEALNENLQRVAEAVDRLERSRRPSEPHATPAETTEPPAEPTPPGADEGSEV
jgi:polyhydroxyalkanoate synthesis repressor PhaR